MEKVDCTLKVTALVECQNPDCENIFDLFEVEHLVDEGYLYMELLSDKGFGKENWNVVKCPECGHSLTIGDVIW